MRTTPSLVELRKRRRHVAVELVALERDHGHVDRPDLVRVQGRGHAYLHRGGWGDGVADCRDEETRTLRTVEAGSGSDQGRRSPTAGRGLIRSVRSTFPAQDPPFEGSISVLATDSTGGGALDPATARERLQNGNRSALRLRRSEPVSRRLTAFEPATP